jgi:hypothetical protein
MNVKILMYFFILLTFITLHRNKHVSFLIGVFLLKKSQPRVKLVWGKFPANIQTSTLAPQPFNDDQNGEHQRFCKCLIALLIFPIYFQFLTGIMVSFVALKRNLSVGGYKFVKILSVLV